MRFLWRHVIIDGMKAVKIVFVEITEDWETIDDDRR